MSRRLHRTGTSVVRRLHALSRLFGDGEKWVGAFMILKGSQCAVVMRQLRLTTQQRLVLVHFLLHLSHTINNSLTVSHLKPKFGSNALSKKTSHH